MESARPHYNALDAAGRVARKQVEVVAARAERKNKRLAAVERSKAARRQKLANDKRESGVAALQHATAAHTRSINAQRRKGGRERTAVARAKAQVAKIAAGIAEGDLIPDAPEILSVPTEPLSMDAGPLIAAKLKSIGARLRDSALRGEKDDLGRSLIPPATLLSLPGVQSLSLACRFLPGGRDRFIEYIQLGALNADVTCLQFWQIWAELTPAERREASFDDVVAAGNIRPADLLAAMVKHAVNMGIDVGRMIAASLHPQVLEAMGQSAVKLDNAIGQGDRFRFLEAQGFLPIPQKGPSIAINANATAGALAQGGTGSGDAAMLSPFQAALQAASNAREEVVEAVIVEHDRRLALPERREDPFAAALSAGVDAREVQTRGSIAADSQKAG